MTLNPTHQAAEPRPLAEPRPDAAEILDGIVALSSDAVISLDEAQRITLFNRAAEEIFGYPAAEVLGQPLDVLIPARFAERHRAEHVPAFAVSHESARRMGERREVFGRRRDGEEFPAEVAISRVAAAGGVRFTAILRDVTERRAREAALRASEQRYRALVESAHDGVFVCDAQNRFVLVNAAFETICGRSSAELLGRSVADVVAPDDLAATPLRRAEVERVGLLETERWLLRPDGTRVRVEVGAVLLANGEVQCAVRDVTARRRVEDDLRERERRFHGIFDSAFQFVGLLAPDGTVVEANRTALEFAGVGAEAVVGRPFWETPWWRHSEAERLRLQEAVAAAADGAFVRYETEHVGADGRSINIDFSLKPIRDADGRVVLLIPEGRDVTEAKRTAARLRESEELFRKAFEHSGIGMALVGLDGRWLRVNRALCQIVGYEPEELLALSFQDITHPDDVGADLALAEELVAGTRESYQLEKRYVHRDGHLVWIRLNGSLVRDESGAARFFIAQIEDVTARQESEAALRRRTAELARSNEELEQFAYVASHDLQEPLRAVASFTSLLAERYGDRLDERAHTWIHYAVDGARQMQVLISDLLALSRVGSRARPFAPTRLDVVVAEVLRSLAPAIEQAGGEITVAPLPIVEGDASQLAQLFQNLLANAVKFHRADTAPRVHVSVAGTDEEWIFSVRDNGIGVEPRFAERIFVIFKRLHTREEYPGTGIGLAICKKIVERHGGRIWIEPAEGGGADVRFSLPRARMVSEPISGNP